MALNGFDGNGNFLRTFPEGGWKGDATAGIKIRADRHDDHDQAMANALSNMICKDGQTTILADIPFNGKRITGLGTPTAPTDAVNKTYADSVKTFTTGTEVSGADLNGRVTFTSPTGANGLAWTGADLSWIARLATAAGPGTPPVPPATINRLVLNDKADGTGTDVVEVRDDGSIKAGAIASGAITSSGNLSVTGEISATGNVNCIGGYGATSGQIVLRPNGIGNAAGQAILDAAGGLNLSGSFACPGNINASGQITASGAVVAGTTLNCSGNANISGDIVCAATIHSRGNHTRVGMNGVLQANVFNIFWAGNYIDIYIDQTPFRLVSGISDYRIKKDIEPLPSTWDKVKALRPISYSTRDFGDLIKADDEVQWGFLAHELQDNLTRSAAVGDKDGERVQSVNPFVIITALTKALQEAMTRIEALEAAA